MYYYSRQDSSGFIYCVRADKVVHGNMLDCYHCAYFRGAYQGQGRECEIGSDGQVKHIEEPFSYMDSKRNVSEGA